MHFCKECPHSNVANQKSIMHLHALTGLTAPSTASRTLTPFGFQGETRSLWKARDVYFNLSPFRFADKIKKRACTRARKLALSRARARARARLHASVPAPVSTSSARARATRGAMR